MSNRANVERQLTECKIETAGGEGFEGDTVEVQDEARAQAVSEADVANHSVSSNMSIQP